MNDTRRDTVLLAGHRSKFNYNDNNPLALSHNFEFKFASLSTKVSLRSLVLSQMSVLLSSSE